MDFLNFSMKNIAAHNQVTRTSRRDDIISWLPYTSRIVFTILTLTYKIQSKWTIATLSNFRITQHARTPYFTGSQFEIYVID